MVTSTTTIKLAIVGAGPSGLVTAKTLLEASDKDPSFKPEITIFESEDRVGGTFRYRSYSNATLVSSKQLTCFSDFRLPLSHHDHLTLPEYVRYLEDYVSHFSLDKRCTFKFNTSVLAIRRGEGEKAPHLVRYKCHEAGAGDVELEESFTHLCVCSGLHVTPAIPEIPGLPPTMTWEQAVKAAKDQQVTSKDKGEELSQAEREDGSEQNSSSAEGIIVLHSSSFKDRSLYSGRKVLIMGTGETGMDMAHEAVKGGAKEIILCTRSGFLMFPAVLADFVVLGSKFDGNLPIDGLITNLFETAYVHPWVAASHLRWFVSDFVIKRVLWALTGTEAGCNQWVGELEPERLGRAFTFLNKSSKAMPYINRGWKNRPWLFEKLASYLDPPSVLPEEPSVDLAPFPHHFRKDGSVSFVKNGRKEYYRMKGRKVQPDVVVYATGYQQNFEFLGKEYPVPATVSCRDVLDPSDPTVSFIGFVRPGVGAIPPIAEMQAQLWTLILRGKLEPPTSTPHYYLLVKESARIKYGVDYSSYVSQLAKDMGSAPSLSELWWRHGLFVTLIYCFGAAFPTFYRLVGPYEHPQAAEISRTELYDTIKRRGVIGNLMMGVIPMAFYALINLFALILEKSLAIPIYVMRVLTSSKRARPVVVTQTQGRPFTDSSRRRDAHNGARNRGRGMGEGEGDPDDGPEQEKYRQSKLGKTMLRLFALIVGVLTLASAPAIVQANTEISNFGPVLCRADHYGHLANRAADQMSANWPTLPISTSANLFSVPVQKRKATKMKVQDEPSSEEGFWLKLDMSDRGRYALPSNEDSYDPRESPRDRLLREVWQGLTWYSGKRYTLRVSWSSQFPTDFRVSVHTPESALAKGGIRWRAEKVEEVVQRGGVGVGQDQTSRFDHVTTAAGEVLPSSAGSSKKVEEREEEERNEVGGTRGEDLVVIKKKSFDRGREFEDVVDSRNVSETRGDREGAENPGQQHVDDEDANVVPLFPCDRLYLHISAFETGLRTPTASLWGSKPEMRGFSSPLAKYPVLSKLLYEVGRISELAFANLSPYTTFQRTGREGDGQEEADEEEEAVTKKVLDMGNGLKISFDEKVETGRKEIVIPVHLTLEKLRLGFLPDTCLSMLAALLPLSLLAYLKALPTVVGFFAGLEGGDGKVKVE